MCIRDRGHTELVVNKQSFGCLPIQRITKEEAAALLRRAYDGGMNYFDTARAYSDSEEKDVYKRQAPSSSDVTSVSRLRLRA